MTEDKRRATVRNLSKEEAEKLLNAGKVKSRVSRETLAALRKSGWVVHPYRIEKKVKGITICIEFCFGDYCTAPYSKKSKNPLEDKNRCKTFLEALVYANLLEQQIRTGQHWRGELD